MTVGDFQSFGSVTEYVMHARWLLRSAHKKHKTQNTSFRLSGFRILELTLSRASDDESETSVLHDHAATYLFNL
jgi:hypothetical protein